MPWIASEAGGSGGSAPNQYAMTVEAPVHLVVSNRFDLRDQIQRRLKIADEVRVDLTHTTLVDSSALGMLVDLTRFAEAEGKTVALVNPPADLREMLEITRKDRVLRLATDCQIGMCRHTDCLACYPRAVRTMVDRLREAGAL